jgi:hypothetical protein
MKTTTVLHEKYILRDEGTLGILTRADKLISSSTELEVTLIQFILSLD